MGSDIFSVRIEESNGVKVWEMDDIPRPNEVNCGTAHYHGQRNVEHLLKVINQKAFMNHEDRFLDPLFSIFQSSLEQGVEDEGTIQWDDRSHYTRISWTGYTWKLPPEIKRRMVIIDITTPGEDFRSGEIMVPLRKIADDGGDILIPPKIVSKMNLRIGCPVNVRIRFRDCVDVLS
ncbi:MAG: hypothetical protein JXA22_00350 [Candidatus Thermoplasmatota archaeon]|nr:hypothetical protein [Candidatus Thermoplasmatota archaeon]